MKKYLIKGLLALVVGGFTASCADKDGDYVPVGQQKATAYADAFKELIGGEVAPDHDWGFTKTSLIDETAQTRAKTRDVDVNGNMWDSRPELGATEERDVLSYMDMTLAEMDAQTPRHIYSKHFPVNMPNFFVTQVHTGDDYYGSAQDPNNKNVLGSTHMNELVIAITESAARPNNSIATNTLPEANSWHHVNNFNAGSSKDWGGNTKFVNMGTCDFAYHNSKDSRFHNRWIVVSGADIDAALGVNKYTGYYYVCFDFQSNVPDQQKDVTKFSCQMKNDSGNWQDGFNGQVDGLYSSAQDIIDAGVTQLYVNGQLVSINDVQNITVTGYEHAHAIIPGDNNYSDWIIRLCAATPGDDVTPGGGSSSTSSTTRTDRVERRRLVAQGRIFCEDLGTNADKISKSDIDFNDAVFDAKIWRKGQFDVEYLDDTYNSESDYLEEIYTDEIKGIDIEMDENRDAHVVVNGKFKYVAEICLLAAGGTIPLKIGGKEGFEIHDKFGEGQKSPRTISHTTIINTVGAPSQEQFTTTVSTDVCDAVTVEVDITEYVKKAIEDGKTDIGLDIIPIDVEWVSGDRQSVGELNSEYGQAPQKLCVPIGTLWVYERIPITTAFKDFKDYAKDYSPSNPLTFWDLVKNTIDTNYLYKNGPEGMTAETGESGNIGSNPFYDEVIIKGPTTTTTEVETVLWEGTQVYGTTEDSNQSLTLYSTTFNDEDDNYIRIYGSVAEGATEVWMTLHDSTWGSIISPSLQFVNGYADTQLNDNQAGSLSNGPTLNIAARNCTITKICKVVKTTTTKLQ